MDLDQFFERRHCMKGAVVSSKDLPKVMRLQDYGFKLKAKPTRNGQVYVKIVEDPREKS